MIADGRPALRAFIFEHLQFVITYAEIARGFADAGDDPGLEYAIRKMLEFAKGVRGSTNDLLEENESEARERAA